MSRTAGHFGACKIRRIKNGRYGASIKNKMKNAASVIEYSNGGASERNRSLRPKIVTIAVTRLVSSPVSHPRVRQLISGSSNRAISFKSARDLARFYRRERRRKRTCKFPRRWHRRFRARGTTQYNDNDTTKRFNGRRKNSRGNYNYERAGARFDDRRFDGFERVRATCD